MNNEQFENLLKEFFDKEVGLLEAQGYRNNYDILLNFKEIGEFIGLDGAGVCLFYLLKHIQNIILTIKENKQLDKWYWNDTNNNEGLRQRIADARNYLLLLAACIEDELEERR